MNLGAFSISLNVKDINKSSDFYQKLGFIIIGGNIEEKWLILKSNQAVIGLFEGMIDKNTLTFNPGWSGEGKNIEPYDDVRVIYQELNESIPNLQNGITQDAGPGYIIVEDPDGNPILIDQHR
ncbi:MAG: VOC family protein [Candidatus Izemoplasmatales bacterium]|nr:VOC family protein [Candidatus Izemoplasmatales bacterium]